MSNKLQAKDLISLGLFTVCQFSFPSWGRYGH